jgi:2'-5' RNA ligase
MDIDTAYREIQEKFYCCLKHGSVDIDEHLLKPSQDSRRGLSLVFRPTDAIAENVAALQKKLARYSGSQYSQPPTDLHTTVLSVIPVGHDYPRFESDKANCERAVVRSIHKLSQSIRVLYRGVIASNDSVLIRGYPETDALQSLRTDIIAELARLGIEENLERRYAPVTAHMTIVRFISQIQRTRKFCRLLGRMSDANVGSMRVRSLELVENDWYMRRETVRLVNAFPLFAVESYTTG